MKGTIGFVVAIFIGFFLFYTYGTSEIVEIMVEDKERVISSSKESVDSKYLIFAETEVFENTDTIMYFKFNSSDLYRDLRPGQTYTVKVYGWRIPIFSMYRNIVKIY